MNKRIVLCLLLAGVMMGGRAQQAVSAETAPQRLTIEEAQRLARDNYPLIRQLGLTEQARDYTLQNTMKGWLPQVSIGARATYQNKVTRLPIDVRQFGVDYNGLPKDQYDASVTVSQTVYDGGAIAANRRVASAQADVQREQANVTLYNIRERVNQLFFSVLLIDEQLRQNLLLQDDLGLGLNTVTAMERGGLANQTDIDGVMVEQVKARQQESSLRTMRQCYLRMLATFCLGPDSLPEGEGGDCLTLVKPSISSLPTPNSSLLTPNSTLLTPNSSGGWGELRPELSMYSAQERLLDTRTKALDSRLMPNVSAFLQGGYGNPGLNMLGNGWDTYLRLGVSVSWNIGALYTRKNDKLLISNQREQIAAEREAFLFNTRLQSQQSSGQIDNLRLLLSQDDEIIRLRESIRSRSERRVKYGTETVNEMLRDINAVGEARQQRALHEVQLLQEIYNLKTINNN